MNRKDIIRMAREQGLPETDTDGVFIVNTDDLGRILSAEREACADMVYRYISQTVNMEARGCLASVAFDIRARGQA
jgi:hypothetical protein